MIKLINRIIGDRVVHYKFTREITRITVPNEKMLQAGNGFNLVHKQLNPDQGKLH